MPVFDSGTIVSNIISESTKLKGDFELDNVLRIDGEFSGSIKSSSKVLIGEKGKAFCNIEADVIEIGGIWEGNAKAKSLIKIYSTGTVKGTIEAPRIIIEEGVLLNGTVKVLKSK
ncbi:MAG: polymer-forming cytoskeletal protein [Exilispira sp.]|jgi:cytoskeletal protein CcmA (bactofilin family)|nr:polymer-forming cytoskeletal protein [Exilispira sp.]